MCRKTIPDILRGAGTQAKQMQDKFLTVSLLCLSNVCVCFSYLSEDEKNLLQFSLLQKEPMNILFLQGFYLCSPSKGNLISYMKAAAKGTDVGAWGEGLLVFLLSACLLTRELFPTVAEFTPKALAGDRKMHLVASHCSLTKQSLILLQSKKMETPEPN